MNGEEARKEKRARSHIGTSAVLYFYGRATALKIGSRHGKIYNEMNTIRNVDLRDQHSPNTFISPTLQRSVRVPYPGQCLIPALLDDLEVSHLNAAHSEVRDLELDLDFTP